jgi:hypothetical protein
MKWFLILTGFFELWPHANHDDYYQYQSGAEARLRLEIAQLVYVEPHLGYGWMGRPDAKIWGSMLNLEASRTLIRTHGVDLYVKFRDARLGFDISRKGVDELDRVRRWGMPEIDTTYAYSIGYYDGGAPIFGYGPITVRGPQILEINRGTLPWYNWEIEAAGELKGIAYSASLSLGGPRGDYPAWDLGVSRELFKGFSAGVRGGRIEPPGWGLPIYRIAAVFSVKAIYEEPKPAFVEGRE